MECLRKLCEICDEQDRIYKCPRCGICTCSLKCCITHKKTTGCDGKRDKTAYVPIRQFNEGNLKSDYHFLEDVLQSRQCAKRTFEVDCGGGNIQHQDKRQRTSSSREILPIQPLKLYSQTAKFLVKQAKDRGTTVLLQPPGMSKRKENISRYDKKTNTISWQLTLVFVLDEHFSMPDLLSFDAGLKDYTFSGKKPQVIGFYVKDARETLSLSDIFNQVFKSLPSGSLLNHLLRTMKDGNDLNVLIRKMPSPANEPMFAQLNLADSLKVNLSGHQIIEFPTLFACHSSLLSRFRLLISSSYNSEALKLDSSIKVNEVSNVNQSTDSPTLPLSGTKTEEENCTEFVGDERFPLEISLQNESENDLIAVGEKPIQILHENIEANFVEEQDQEEELHEEASSAIVDEEDEGYEEFMKNLVEFQAKDIRSLRDIIEKES